MIKITATSFSFYNIYAMLLTSYIDSAVLLVVLVHVILQITLQSPHHTKSPTNYLLLALTCFLDYKSSKIYDRYSYLYLSPPVWN